MIFTKDQLSESYERSVFSFFDLTGNLGGLFEVLELVGALFVEFFAGKIFLYSILSRLYQVDSHKAEEEGINQEMNPILKETQREADSIISINFRLDEP